MLFGMSSLSPFYFDIVWERERERERERADHFAYRIIDNVGVSVCVSVLMYFLLSAIWYSKILSLKRSLKNRQKKILMTNGSLMQVEIIAECSPWGLFESGRLT